MLGAAAVYGVLWFLYSQSETAACAKCVTNVVPNPPCPPCDAWNKQWSWFKPFVPNLEF